MQQMHFYVNIYETQKLLVLPLYNVFILMSFSIFRVIIFVQLLQSGLNTRLKCVTEGSAVCVKKQRVDDDSIPVAPASSAPAV